MELGFKMSTEHKKCTVCGRKTGMFMEYEQSGITVSIPICDDVYENRYCYKTIDVKKMTRKFLTQLKSAIKEDDPHD